MRRPLTFLYASAIGGIAALSASAEEGVKLRAPDRNVQSEIERYCGALAPGASEARAAYQLRRLADLEVQVREAVEKLEAREQAAREWVTKRDEMMKAATDDVVAIYAKMPAENAAPKLAAMDEVTAAAVLAKLNPRTASAILSEMETEKAAKLSTLLAGALPSDRS
jgi:flagellar motility protein MotE (MotC chaperone)